jgi:hypothetical protein
MDTAPTDGTMVRLLVKFTEHDTEDTGGPSWTIGAFSSPDEPDACWQFAGWCWTHDHFTEGKGEPIGWLPMTEPARTGEAAPASTVVIMDGCTPEAAAAAIAREIADMHLDGTLCETCGVFLNGPAPGHPRYCRSCRTPSAPSKPKKKSGHAPERVPCTHPGCSARVRPVGLRDHLHDAHGVPRT